MSPGGMFPGARLLNGGRTLAIRPPGRGPRMTNYSS
jgi:hypothetical protein